MTNFLHLGRKDKGEMSFPGEKLHFHILVVSVILKDRRDNFDFHFSVTIIFIVVCAVNCSHHEHRQKTLLSETRLFMVGKYSLVIMT